MIIGVVRTLQKSEMLRINFDNLRRDVSTVTVVSHSQTGGCGTICDMQKSYPFYEDSPSLCSFKFSSYTSIHFGFAWKGNLEVRYYLLQYSTWNTLFGTTPQHITRRTKLVWTCIKRESDKSLYYRHKKKRKWCRQTQRGTEWSFLVPDSEEVLWPIPWRYW